MGLRDLVYTVYERRLAAALHAAGSPVPRHVGVILDGNRRWARSVGAPSHEGHQRGADKIIDLLRWCDEAGVEVVILWLLSTDNLARPEAELAPLLTIIENVVSDLASPANPWTLNVVGALDLLPADTARRLKESTEGTSIEEVAELLDVDKIGEHLYTSGQPDPDLVIRTSGEQRLGGFLLWQSAHSEFYFCDAYWPDFRHVDFLRALRAYAARQRRYGS